MKRAPHEVLFDMAQQTGADEWMAALTEVWSYLSEITHSAIM